MLLQASSNLVQWSDLLLVSPAFNGIEAEMPPDTVPSRFFYRLQTLVDPLQFRPNKFPGDPHLGSIVSGRNIEIQLFGTRDAEGYPLNLTSVHYRLGSRHYIASTASSPDATLAEATSPPPAPAPIRYISGLVSVDLSESCWPSHATPVVQYAAREPVSGGTSVHQIAGEVKCRYEFSDPSTAVYSYSAPYYFTYPVPLDDGRYMDAFNAMWDFNSSSVSLAMRGVMAGAFVAGALTAPVTLTVLGITAVTSGVVGYVAYHNDEVDYADLTAPLVASELRLKALIPNGDAHKLAESQTVTVSNPQLGTVAPLLVLEAFCGQAVYFTPEWIDQSHLRNDFDYYNSSRSQNFGHFTFIKKPISVDVGDSKYDFHSLPTKGSGSGDIRFQPGSSAISFVSQLSAVVSSSGVNLIASTDGRYDFRLQRGNGTGGSVALEFRTYGTGVTGMISVGTGIHLRQFGSTTNVTTLSLGVRYGFEYLSRIDTTSTTMTKRNGGMKLEILGQTRDSRLSESYVMP